MKELPGEESMSYEKEHLAAPEQIEHGFDEGVGRRPRRRPQHSVGRVGSKALEAPAVNPRYPRWRRAAARRSGRQSTLVASGAAHCPVTCD
jgi:hypothetical protein